MHYIHFRPYFINKKPRQIFGTEGYHFFKYHSIMKSSKRPSKDSTRPKRTEKPKNNERPKRSDKPKSDARPKRDDTHPKRSHAPRDERPKRTFNSDHSHPQRFDAPREERPKRTFNSDDSRPKRSDAPREERPKRTFNSDDSRPKRSDTPREDRPKRTFNSDDSRPKRFDAPREDRPKRTFNSDDSRPKRFDESREERPKRTFNSDDSRPKRFDESREERPKRTFNSDDSRSKGFETSREERPKRTFNSDDDSRPKRSDKLGREARPRTKSGSDRPPANFKPNDKGVFKPHIEKLNAADDDDMRLNKYVANCGVAARRKAGEMILAGEITVNGKVITEPGYRVLPKDVVKLKGKDIKPVERKIYLLMNKPKDTITTVSDERGRKTVIDLVKRTVKERIFPVGRLDRDTTGLLLLTNDGDLAQAMAHPSYRIKKLYHAVLDKALTKSDLEGIAKGVELEDGLAEVDGIQYVSGASKDEVMIEIHIGKNRIVRRIFEHLGYQVMRLDRVFYGGLTKKDLPRAGYRTLTDREVIMLKHFTGK